MKMVFKIINCLSFIIYFILIILSVRNLHHYHVKSRSAKQMLIPMLIFWLIIMLGASEEDSVVHTIGRLICLILGGFFYTKIRSIIRSTK